MNNSIYGKTINARLLIMRKNVTNIKMSFGDKKEAKRLFQKLPFYNVLIEKPRIKYLRNIDLLHELSFCDELSIRKYRKHLKRYARSYRIELIDSKDPLAQLKASKSSIKDLFKGLLDEIKGFRYQITVKVLLSKHKENGDRICSCLF